MSGEPQKTAKRMGRPPKAPEKGKRQNYTFRMSDADRDRIVAAAEISGRSLSEEIEQRLIRLGQLEDELGSGSRLDFLRLMAVTLRFTERLTGSADYDERSSLLECKSALNAMMDTMLRSKGAPSKAQALADALGDAGAIGRAAALTLATGAFGLPEDATERDIAARKASAALVASILASGQPGGEVGRQQALEADIQLAAEREGVSPEELLKRIREDITKKG